jgi:hypothetical protein
LAGCAKELTTPWQHSEDPANEPPRVAGLALARSLIKKEGARPKRHNPKNNMASTKKKVSAKASVKFKDLKSKKNPKGVISWSGSTGGDDSPTESVSKRF